VIQEICWGGQAPMPGIIYVSILLLFILNKLLEIRVQLMVFSAKVIDFRYLKYI